MKKIKKLSQKKTKKKSKIRIVLDCISYAIFTFIFALICVVAVQAFKGEQPNIFSYCYYYIETGSMKGDNKDSFDKGTVILSKLIKEKDCYSLKVGDIITFTPQDKNLPSYVTTETHRIISIDYETKTIVTQGDANSSSDEPISFKDVKSKFILKSGFVTIVYKLIRSWYGFLILIFVPLCGLIVLQIYSTILASRKEKINKEVKELEKDTSLEEKKKLLEQQAIEEYLKNQESSKKD